MNRDLEQQLKSLNRSPASEPDPDWTARVRTKLDWMTENPVPPHVPAFDPDAVPRPWTRLFAFSASALALLVLLAGGVAYAAQAATPDQWLYPVKLAGEDARRVLAANSEARAKLELEFASRRVEELTRMAQKKKLDAITAKSIQARYQEHVAAALSAIPGASAQAAAALTNDISAHADQHAAEVETEFDEELDRNPTAAPQERTQDDVRAKVRDMLEFARESRDAARFLHDNNSDRMHMRLKVERSDDGKAHVKIELRERKDGEVQTQTKEWAYPPGDVSTGTTSVPFPSVDEDDDGKDGDKGRRKQEKEAHFENKGAPAFRVESRNGTTTIFFNDRDDENEDDEEDNGREDEAVKKKFNRFFSPGVQLNVSSEQTADGGTVEQYIETSVRSESSIKINHETQREASSEEE